MFDLRSGQWEFIDSEVDKHYRHVFELHNYSKHIYAISS